MLAACAGGTPPPTTLATLPASQARPDLSGTWVLDPEAAEKPMARLADLTEALRRADPLAQPAAPGAVPTASGTLPEEFGPYLRPARTLQIDHADPLLRIRSLGQVRELYTDLRAAAVTAGGAAGQRVAVAGWENAAVVVETAFDGDARVVQRYHLRDGALHVDQLFDLPRLERPLVVTLTYRRER